MNRRLLILDDEPGILEAYAGILAPRSSPTVRSSRQVAGAAPQPTEAIGAFEPTYVSNGPDALKAIETALTEGRPFAGGFFDVKLGPGWDGIETLKRAKDVDTDFLCVIVTAYQDRSIEDITKLFGETFSDRWDFLSKPFTRGEILQKANNLVANWDRRKREKEYIERIKTQQEQLVRSERLAAVGTLARGIGHEFGNILLSIMGNADLALQTKDPQQMEEALQLVGKSSERAAVILRNLQSMVKKEAIRVPHDIHIPIKEALELVAFELRKQSIALTHQYAKNLPLILMDRIEIGQVFLNLTINAIHAVAGRKGQIHVETKLLDGGVQINFSDNGKGIEPKHLGRIFEPLFTTKEGTGSGIGLSVSKKIIETHQGQIHVNSILGQGTTFAIWLPAADSIRETK